MDDSQVHSTCVTRPSARRVHPGVLANSPACPDLQLGQTPQLLWLCWAEALPRELHEHRQIPFYHTLQTRYFQKNCRFAAPLC